jgi:toxin-antitoxin system PIN domain toxin
VTHLLDGSVLIALSTSGHVHHASAMAWFSGLGGSFATCPSTQGTLIRFLVRETMSPMRVMELLQAVVDLPNHVFWPDDAPYDRATLRGVMGHRQVTDAYLAAQARRRGGRLATLDEGLAATHPDVVDLVPTP